MRTEYKIIVFQPERFFKITENFDFLPRYLEVRVFSIYLRFFFINSENLPDRKKSFFLYLVYSVLVNCEDKCGRKLELTFFNLSCKFFALFLSSISVSMYISQILFGK